MTSRVLAWAGLVAGTAGTVLAACAPSVDLDVDDVIVGLAAEPLTLTADGQSRAVVRVATVPDHVKDGLTVKLTAIGASWAGASGATVESPLGPDGETTATLVASRVVGDATVVAELAGYQRSLSIPLTPAPIGSCTRTISGRLTAGAVSSVLVTVQPQVAGVGLPSAGTRVELAITSVPAASAYLTTEAVVMDSTASAVATTVVASSTTTHVEVGIHIAPPAGGVAIDCPPVTLSQLP